MNIEHPEQEPGLTPHGPSYPVEQLKNALGAEIDPLFEPHVIDRDESKSFGELERGLSDACKKLGLDIAVETDAYIDFIQNRLGQLTGSICLRERNLLRRVLGDEAAERGEIEEDAIGGLTESERAAYFDQTTSSNEELGYAETKVQMEAVLSTNQGGGRIFAVKPNNYQTFEPLFGTDDEPVGMEFETINLAARPITRIIETLHFSEPESPGHDLEADTQLNELEAALPSEAKEVSLMNLTSFRSRLSEFNRRLDLLAGLDDLKLRAAVFNGTGLDKLFSPSTEDGMPSTFRSWE